MNLTHAAIRAIVLAARDDVREQRSMKALGRLDTLAIALDPAHQEAPAEDAEPTRAWRVRVTGLSTDWPMVRAGTIPGEASKPAATAPAEPSIPTAGTPAPPTQAAQGRSDRRLRATPADDDLLRDLWPQAIPFREMMRRFNERASSPVKSDVRLRERAIRLGLPTQRQQAMVDAGNAPAGRGMVKGVWTPERDALLTARYPREGIRVELLEALNALPGPPIESANALKARAHRLNLRLDPEGIKRIGAELAAKARAGLAAKRAERRATIAAAKAEPDPAADLLEPAPQPDPTEPDAAAPPPPPYTPPTPADTKAEAFEAFDGGMTVRAAVADFGIPLSTLSNWHAEWKLARRKDGAA